MSLASFGTQMLAEIRRIAEQIVRRDGTHLRWATVTSVSPLRIRYDGEPDPSIVTPQTTAAGLNVGDRVRVAKQNGQATIIGPTDGHRAISDGTNFLRIGADVAGPRLWVSDNALREYDDPPNMYVTGAGTIGRSTRPVLWGAEGKITVTPSGGVGSATVTFPPGLFTSTPTIVVSADSVSTTVANAQYTNASANSVTVVIQRSTNTGTGVSWIAAQS